MSKKLYSTFVDERATSLLKGERSNASFSSRAMGEYLFGGAESLRRHEYLVSLLRSAPEFENIHVDYFTLSDRNEAVKRSNERKLRTQLLIAEHDLDALDAMKLQQLSAVMSFTLHDNVFVPTILNMSDDAQLAEWAPKVLNYEWIGCYAQTEIAHGSNVRGLLTTATYVGDSDEFEIHTPSLAATKWWVGALGVISTHCVLYARLVIDGHDHGIHNFLVPIRCVESHRPLPGVTVGDIGPKMSTNHNDNGFLRFDRVRIPRANMLMKYARVDARGLYSRPGPAKGAYGTMTRVRAGIVMMSSDALSKAAAIAVRYSSVRCQEPGAAASDERPVLDYRSQQYRLLPIVASSYALRFVGRAMMADYFELDAQLQNGDYSNAGVMHATSCALKSLCTTIGADSIEEARRACGGHGFHQFSALPELFGQYQPFFVAEGNNWLLSQQTSRFLLKLVGGGANAQQGGAKLPPSADYLSGATLPALLAAEPSVATSLDHFCELDRLLGVFRHSAAARVASTARAIQQRVARGDNERSVWLDHLVDHYKLSRAHGLYSIVRTFVAACRADELPDESLRAPLTRLCRLFALSSIERHLGQMLLDGSLSRDDAARHLQPALDATLDMLRPDAVALVDSFQFSDFELNSALGRHDGQYIRTLYNWALDDPLNQCMSSEPQSQVPPPGYKALRQLMTLHARL
jgi:acyl-CoA oxidase